MKPGTRRLVAVGALALLTICLVVAILSLALPATRALAASELLYPKENIKGQVLADKWVGFTYCNKLVKTVDNKTVPAPNVKVTVQVVDKDENLIDEASATTDDNGIVLVAKIFAKERDKAELRQASAKIDRKDPLEIEAVIAEVAVEEGDACLPPVGGIAEPVTLSGEAQAHAAGGGSGPSADAIAAVAGGAAAVVAAGGWYARRRWLR
jgi:hypothetical protein